MHLIEFKEQQLKSKGDFGAALGLVEDIKFKEYMSKYALTVPGDWPAQFYARQNVYSACYPDGPPLESTQLHFTNTRDDPENTVESGTQRESVTSHEWFVVQLCLGALEPGSSGQPF